MNLGKIYEPSAMWMRFLLRTPIKRPVTALDGVSFTLRAGEICAVVGPNGAGKSTLFRILTGLTTPTTGRATVLGLDATTESHEVRRRVGFAPADDRSLYLRHTARDNLIFHASLQHLPRKRIRQRVDEVLELVGLADAGDRVGFALSAGMRSRLQLARALLHEPRVLILDEPTGAIDPVASYHLLETLEQVTAERRLGVLISSHRLEEIEALHDSVLLLNRGQIVHRGRLDELRRSWERPRLAFRFSSDQGAQAAAAKLRDIEGVELVSAKLPAVVVSTEFGAGRVLAMLNGELAELESVTEATVSLREVLTQVAATAPGEPPPVIDEETETPGNGDRDRERMRRPDRSRQRREDEW